MILFYFIDCHLLILINLIIIIIFLSNIICFIYKFELIIFYMCI